MGKTFKDTQSKYGLNRSHRRMPLFNKKRQHVATRCGINGKVAWKSFDEALSRLQQIKQSDPSANLRIYQCELCQWFHLTSKI